MSSTIVDEVDYFFVDFFPEISLTLKQILKTKICYPWKIYFRSLQKKTINILNSWVHKYFVFTEYVYDCLHVCIWTLSKLLQYRRFFIGKIINIWRKEITWIYCSK